MTMSISIQRFIERYYPDVIKAGHEQLGGEQIPSMEGIQRLHIISRGTADCDFEGKLLFVAAFLFLYDKKVILIDSKLKNGLRSIISDELKDNGPSVSRRIASVKLYYSKVPAFRRKVERILSQFNKAETEVIEVGEER